jgi:hypothetical protein
VTVAALPDTDSDSSISLDLLRPMFKTLVPSSRGRKNLRHRRPRAKVTKGKTHGVVGILIHFSFLLIVLSSSIVQIVV